MSGQRFDSLKQRVELLERELDDMRRQIRHQNVGLHTIPQQPRLAQTVAGSGGYPTEISAPTVYPIVFLDGSFTESPGTQTPSWIEHSSNEQRYAFSLSTGYIPQDSIVQVWRQNNRYWITPAIASTPGEEGGQDSMAFIDPRFYWTLGANAGTEDSSDARGYVIRANSRTAFNVAFDNWVGVDLGIVHDPDDAGGFFQFPPGKFDLRIHCEATAARVGGTTPPMTPESFMLSFFIGSRRLWAHFWDTDTNSSWSSDVTSEGTYEKASENIIAKSGGYIRDITDVDGETIVLEVRQEGNTGATTGADFGGYITRSATLSSANYNPLAFVVTKIA